MIMITRFCLILTTLLIIGYVVAWVTDVMPSLSLHLQSSLRSRLSLFLDFSLQLHSWPPADVRVPWTPASTRRISSKSKGTQTARLMSNFNILSACMQAYDLKHPSQLIYAISLRTGKRKSLIHYSLRKLPAFVTYSSMYACTGTYVKIRNLLSALSWYPVAIILWYSLPFEVAYKGFKTLDRTQFRVCS